MFVIITRTKAAYGVTLSAFRAIPMVVYATVLVKNEKEEVNKVVVQSKITEGHVSEKNPIVKTPVTPFKTRYSPKTLVSLCDVFKEKMRKRVWKGEKINRNQTCITRQRKMKNTSLKMAKSSMRKKETMTQTTQSALLIRETLRLLIVIEHVKVLNSVFNLRRNQFVKIDTKL